MIYRQYNKDWKENFILFFNLFKKTTFNFSHLKNIKIDNSIDYQQICVIKINQQDLIIWIFNRDLNELMDLFEHLIGDLNELMDFREFKH